MIQKIRLLIYFLLFALLAFGAWTAYQWWSTRTKVHTEESATVLLERIQKVSKLTTVEGYFSELYENKSFQYFDLYPFQKKVIVRVKAKVSVGFDLEQLNIEADQASKTVFINQLPDPQILSIDHDLDYYDISEGLFTSFSETDYNKIQTDAKELIRKKASASTLLAEAATQGNDFIDMIRLFAETSGWQFKVRSRPALKQ
ncbi:MAG: DUF4230 domain-containing protein [Saprospiraceae bacterium]|nr:DUF4230 domain-containing protein [Saprospiraceae bacterium]